MIYLIICLGILNVIFGYLFAKYSEKVTNKEFIFSSIVIWVLMFISYGIWYGVKTHDNYFINNEIVAVKYTPYYKYHSTCSYSCHCRPKKGCRICWRPCVKSGGDYYSYALKNEDYSSWFFSASDFYRMGHLFNKPYKIRGNRPSGTFDSDMNDYVYKPKDDAIVPYSSSRGYINKPAVSENLIVGKTIYDDDILKYPDTGYNFNVNKVVGDLRINNDDIGAINARLERANIIVYGIKNGNTQQCEAVKSNWKNGKLNDLVFCITSTDNKTIEYVKVFGWTKNEVLKKELESMVVNKKFTIFKDLRKQITDKINKDYEELDMEQYSYLDVYISSTTRNWFIAVFLLIIGIAWSVCYFNDWDDDEEEWEKNYRWY